MMNATIVQSDQKRALLAAHRDAHREIAKPIFGTVHLQGLGACQAKQVQHFEKNDVIIFNYGIRYTILSSVRVGATRVCLTMKNCQELNDPDARIHSGTYSRHTYKAFSR